MAHLIDKDALVAEIERKINEVNPDNIEDWRYRLQRERDIEIMKNILSLINTFEVKEVDSSRFILAYNEFKKRQPTLVDDLLRKSMREPENERQTIYGEVCDVVGDLYTDLSLKELSAVAKLLIGDYVFRHAYCLQK